MPAIILETGHLKNCGGIYTITLLTAADIDSILHFQENIFALLPEQKHSFLLKRDKACFERHFAEGHLMLGIIHDEHLIAQCMIVHPTRKIAETGDKWLPTDISLIQGIAVHPNYRGNALMSKMADIWLHLAAKAKKQHALAVIATENLFSLSTLLKKRFSVEGIYIDEACGTQVYHLHKEIMSVAPAQKRLAIIGAGPKAMNILARAEAMEACGWDVPEIIVLEKNNIGANWSGAGGYTDGKGTLGSPPVKTLGYPFSSFYGQDVAEATHKYSFYNYLAAKGQLTQWVDGGMPWIRHAAFAEYLQWVGGHFKEKIVQAEVVKISKNGTQWVITCQKEDSTERLTVDGLVITGPGETSYSFDVQSNGATVFDGKDWWLHKEKFSGFRGSVALIGGGISAGAVFEAMMPLLDKTARVDWHTRRGIFTRSENYSNNQRFSEQSLWQLIPEHRRTAYIQATDRGSIDPATHKTMSEYAQQFKDITGDIHSITQENDGRIKMIFSDGLSQKQRLYDRVIICTRFSNSSFLALFDAAAIAYLKETSGLEALDDDHLPSAIRGDLSLAGSFPKLHLPMLSWKNAGVGCATLGSISVMADRVLMPWTQKKMKPQDVDGLTVLPAPGKGESLFANRLFAKGDLVVKGSPVKVSPVRTQTSVQMGIELHTEPSYWFLKANHSCNPNCGVTLNDTGGYSLIALRPIPAGEEITWDYAMTEWESIALGKTPCQCQDENCRVSIGGYKHLSPQLRQKYTGFVAPYLALYE